MGLLVKIRNKLSLSVGHALIGRREDDRFLASFPRSGSTWLRTILVNIMVPGANSDPDVFNAVIPGVSIRHAPAIRRLPSPRLIHSHTCCRREISRVVYTVRDGRDASISFYHYLTTRRGISMPFDKWFAKYERHEYGPTWDEHVRSWFVAGARTLGDNLLIVRFERMKAEPIATVIDICGHLALEADVAQVASAVEKACIENARKIERQRAGSGVSGDASFYRGGKTGQWEEYLSGAVADRFWLRSGASMELAGYDR